MDHLEIIAFGIIFVTSRKCFFISDLVQKFERSHVVRYDFFFVKNTAFILIYYCKNQNKDLPLYP